MLYQKLKTAWRLPLKYKTIFVINFILSGVFRACIKIIPLHKLSCYFGKPYRNEMLSTLIPQENYAHVLKLKKAIALVSRYTPWESTCLVQAMLAKFWCQRLNIPYVFYIGFRKDSNEPSGYAAHAWLTVGPIAVCGGHSFSSFRVVSSYLKR